MKSKRTRRNNFVKLSGTIGSAPGGIGGMSFDAWENAALIDTGETNHIALVLSPDGGSSSLKLYIGLKGKDSNGSSSNSFLARNGLAYGRWYYLKSSLPGSVGSTNSGTFDTTSAGALSASKMEDIDTSPSKPDRIVLGNQNSGVFTFDFDLVFSGGFSAGASRFTVTKISSTSGGSNSVDAPDNVDWTAATNLAGVSYPDGLIFVNEDNSTGEIWSMKPNGSSKVRVGQTTVGAESSGIFDLSAFVGFAPGSVLVTNNQGSPSSMTVLINPNATRTSGCGDRLCDSGESPLSCAADCPVTTDQCPSDPAKTQPGVCGCGRREPYDESGYRDAQGYTCAGWKGYDCSQAAEKYGYTAAQENDILARCSASCRVCPGSSNGGDQCPSDPAKTQPGQCGCGRREPYDLTGYRDAQGYTCAGWQGYDCSQAAEKYGYTAAQENDILARCSATCGVCPAM